MVFTVFRRCAAWDGQIVLTGGETGNLMVWDLVKIECLLRISLHGGKLFNLFDRLRAVSHDIASKLSFVSYENAKILDRIVRQTCYRSKLAISKSKLLIMVGQMIRLDYDLCQFLLLPSGFSLGLCCFLVYRVRIAHLETFMFNLTPESLQTLTLLAVEIFGAQGIIVEYFQNESDPL